MPEIFLPVHDRILVMPIEASNVSDGGIILPDQAKERLFRGIVMAVGPGRTVDRAIQMFGSFGDLSMEDIRHLRDTLRSEMRDPMCCQAGDKIIYGKYTGSEITVAKKTMIVLRNDDVLGIIREIDAPVAP